MSQILKQLAWWDEFNGTKISPIWLPHMAPIQASYSPIQNPLTALYSSPIQKRTVNHRKMSQILKQLAWWDEVQWYKDQPHMTAPYGPHSSLLQPPFRIPLQPHTVAPFKRELSIIEKWVRYQNDQHYEMSSMVPRSALYDHPVWLPFKPLMALFRIPLQPHTGAPFKREPLVIEKWARYQNNWHDKMSSMVPRSVLYDCPVWPPFKPLTALFSLIQPHTPARYHNDQDSKLSSLVPRSSPSPYNCPIWPHSSLLWPHSKSPYSLLWPLWRRTSGCTETRQVSKWSAWQDECSGYRISPIWLPHMGPIQAPYGPIQNPLTASNGPVQRR